MKLLKGGNNLMDNIQLKLFFSIIIIGYFGIKIIYGTFFGYYPNKYYYKNVEITSNSKDNHNIENITLNAYIPGLWNTEMTDFITTLVLCLIIYVFTYVTLKSVINDDGNINIGFIAGYIIGLGYPIFYINNDFTTNTQINNNYALVTFIIVLALTIFVINILTMINLTNKERGSYIVYVLVLLLLFFGLILSRKKSENYSVVTYFNSNNEECSFNKNGVIQTSGEWLNITLPFMSFVLILLCCYEPTDIISKYIYIMIYGLLLGCLVSGISYFGMEYFLEKTPEKVCNSVRECTMKKMALPVENKIVNEIDLSLNSLDLTPETPIKEQSKAIHFLSKYLMNITLTFFVILIMIYLIYFFIFK